MSKNKGKKRIAFVLTGGYSIGGAESRFVNAFNFLLDNSKDYEYFLFVSGKRLAALCKHGLLEESKKNIIINCPVFYQKLLKKRYAKSFLLYSQENKHIKLGLIKKIIIRLIRWIHFVYNVFFLLVFVIRKKIDVIHPVTEGSPPSGIVKTFMPGIFLVSTYLSLNPSYHKTGLFYLYSSQYLSLKKSDMIDVLGVSYLKALKKTGFKINPDKTVITKCSFVKPFNVSHKKEKVIVFSGRLIDQKNPLLFVEAARLVINSGSYGVKFLILGTGPLKNSLENRIKLYNIDDFIKIDYCFNQSEVLSKSLIFCSLQNIDNYPSQSLLQAMYAQNGIVATNFGETGKLIKHNETGLLVDPNPADISRQIIYLLKNPEKLKTMGQKASELVAREHNIIRFSNYLNSIYTDLIN